MTQEEKQLLLTDLCGRLPYGVKCKASHGLGNTDKKHEYIGVLKFVGNCYGVIANYYEDVPHDTGLINNVFYDIEYIKPYLRPLSNMTEEEKKEVSILLNYEFYIDDDCALVAEDDRHRIRLDLMQVYIDWLNAHHFDYRTDEEGKTLIEKGLALEAPEGMYATK